MGEKITAFHGRNSGFSFKGNKRQLSLIQSNMKKTFGNEVTVGKISTLLNNFARVRWQLISSSGL